MTFVLQPWEWSTILEGVFTCDTATLELLQQPQAVVEKARGAGCVLPSVTADYLLPTILPNNFFTLALSGVSSKNTFFFFFYGIFFSDYFMMISVEACISEHPAKLWETPL